jgi:inorganic pyrophosphatase
MFPETQTHGDRDPLDACEIGEQVAYTGQIKQVKLLGLMLLLDEGETDWKIFVIDVNDPLSSKLNDVEAIETHCPGLLRESVKWFKYYKVPDGKAVNEVAFGGTFKNREYAQRSLLNA